MCTGCGLCQMIAAKEDVTLGISDEGFYRPQPAKEISEASGEILYKVCPGINVDIRSDDQNPSWGPIRELYSGYSTDEALRFKASSGGALSEVVSHLLESGAVAGVVRALGWWAYGRATDRPCLDS